MNIDQRKQYLGLDLLKVLAIIFVCLYHYSTFLLDFNAWPILSTCVLFIKSILRWCVPLFLFINGFLIFSKNLDVKKHYRKCFKMIYIFLFWVGINFITISIISGSFTLNNLLNCLLIYIGYTNYLWFLVILFLIYITLPIFKILYNKNPKLFCYIVVSVALISGLINLTYFILLNLNIAISPFFNVIFNIFSEHYTMSFICFYLGGIVEINKDKIHLNCFWLGIVLLISVALNYFLIFNVYNVIDVIWYGYSSIFTYIEICCLSLMCLKITLRGKFAKVVGYIGKNTLGIYLIHWVVMHILMKITPLIITPTTVPGAMLITLILLIVKVLMSLLINYVLIKSKILKWTVSFK